MNGAITVIRAITVITLIGVITLIRVIRVIRVIGASRPEAVGCGGHLTPSPASPTADSPFALSTLLRGFRS